MSSKCCRRQCGGLGRDRELSLERDWAFRVWVRMGLSCGLARGWWTGWGRGPSLTAAHSEAALNPTPSTRQVRERRGQNSPAGVCALVVCGPKALVGKVWRQAVRVPKASADSVFSSGGSCTDPRRRQGVCFVAASECAAVSEGHGAHPLTAAARTSPVPLSLPVAARTSQATETLTATAPTSQATLNT